MSSDANPPQSVIEPGVDESFEVRSERFTFVTSKFTAPGLRASGEGDSEGESAESDGGESAESADGESDGESTGETDG